MHEQLDLAVSKKLSELTDEEAVKVVERGEKPIASVSTKMETELPFLEFDLPTIYYSIVDNQKIVDEVRISKEYIYYQPGQEMKAYRLKQLFIRSNERQFKPKPGDIWTSHYETEKYHREVGKLLGYSEEEINEFVQHLKGVGQLRETTN